MLETVSRHLQARYPNATYALADLCPRIGVAP
jgi:hypothetical protein